MDTRLGNPPLVQVCFPEICAPVIDKNVDGVLFQVVPLALPQPDMDAQPIRRQPDEVGLVDRAVIVPPPSSEEAIDDDNNPMRSSREPKLRMEVIVRCCSGELTMLVEYLRCGLLWSRNRNLRAPHQGCEEKEQKILQRTSLSVDEMVYFSRPIIWGQNRYPPPARAGRGYFLEREPAPLMLF